MVAANVNHICIKYHLKVETNKIEKAIAHQGLFFNELSYFSDDGHKVAYSTATKPGVIDKGVDVSPIIEERLAISLPDNNYYEDMGRPNDPNFMECIWIKHIKSLIQTQNYWSEIDLLPEFSHTMSIMNFLDVIRDQLRNKLRIRNIPLSYVVYARILPDSIGHISPTKPYTRDTRGFHVKFVTP